ncbi:ornithine cyclodeaminase family protein [Halalkalibacterium ligniniphilum]|uniref:ornithine cyclodeaminase family protein n=1 Tax=Halalkalibacterium ligniniphilum TaxID=1134413 RepID=UPI0003479CB6|nr:ornithine cyclodeaminase family protein [Halalkalibacterium ligniniphilum]
MLVISANEQRSLMKMNEVIDQTAKALCEFSAGRTLTPIRTSLPFGNLQNTALFMPSIAENLGSLGLKVVNVNPGNKNSGKKTINGIVMLSDFETGEPLSLLEGSYLTMVRTGALSGLATKHLSRLNSKTVSVIGTGEQAKGLIEAVLAVRDIEKINLYNRTIQKAHEFAQSLKERFEGDIQVFSNSNEAIGDADIIVTATNSATPVFSQALQSGIHVNAVGSFRPTMQELPSHVMATATKIVVESTEAALEETGDLQVPIQEGVIHERDIYAELGQITSGERTGRDNDSEITVFKSVGLAVVDIVLAKYLYEKAIAANIGTRIEL